MNDLGYLDEQLRYQLQICLLIVCIIGILFPLLRCLVPGLYNTINHRNRDAGRIPTADLDGRDGVRDIVRRVKCRKIRALFSFGINHEQKEYINQNKFVRTFFRFQNATIMIFALLSVYQLLISIPLHWLSTTRPGEHPFVTQLIHNVPQRSLVQLNVILDIVVCIVVIETVMNRYYQRFYLGMKLFEHHDVNTACARTASHALALDKQTRSLIITFYRCSNDVTSETIQQLSNDYNVRQLAKMHAHMSRSTVLQRRIGLLAARQHRIEQLLIEVQKASLPAHYADMRAKQLRNKATALRYRLTDLQGKREQLQASSSIISYIVEFQDSHGCASAHYKYNLPVLNITTRIAPLDDELISQNINLSVCKVATYRTLYVLLVIFLVAFYFFPQQILLSQISSQQTIWYNILSNVTCKRSVFCQWMFKILFTLIPITINGCLIGCIPFLVWYGSVLWCCISQSQRRRISFVTLVFFYSIFWGIISLVLPTVLYDNFLATIGDLFNLSFTQIIKYIGQNLAVQTLVFMQFIIVKYVLFPVFSLIRIPHIIYTCLVKAKDLVTGTKSYPQFQYDYHMKMAYFMHLFVSGVMFMPIAPLNTMLVLFCLMIMSVCDRYNIYYIADTRDELNMSPDCFQEVVVITRISIVLMLLICCSYFSYIQGFALKWHCFGVCVLGLTAYLIYVYADRKKLKQMLAQNIYLYGRQAVRV